MSKHTPGPWFVREPSIFNRNWIVENTIGLWIEVPPGEYTARLIAAAPELLQFVKSIKCYRQYDCLETLKNNIRGFNPCDRCAVISKADGHNE